MRVIAGTARGRRLTAPDGVVTRPTPERVREAVFNSLHSLGAVTGARMLDLYAGTGALGIEALSRGAAHAVFVENDRHALAALRSNLASTGTARRAAVLALDASAALDSFRRNGESFDVALADPPYAFDGWAALLDRIPAAMVVIESDRPVEAGPAWNVRRCRRYGATVVTLVSNASHASPGPNSSGPNRHGAA